MDPFPWLEALRAWLERSWSAHGLEIVLVCGVTAIVLGLLYVLNRLRRRMSASEAARLSETGALSARMSELERRLGEAVLYRSMAERMLVEAADKPGADNPALAELRQELAVEAINRLELMRLHRNESDLWNDLSPALDKLIVGQVSGLTRRLGELDRDAIDRELADETLIRLRSAQEDRRSRIWASLEPVLDAVIIRLASELPDSAGLALQEKLEEELVEEVHNRLIIAKAMRQQDDLWIKISPVLDRLIVDAAGLISAEEIAVQLKPHIAGWILELASSKSALLQRVLSAELAKIVHDVFEGSKEQIRECASRSVQSAIERSIEEQTAKASLVCRKYVNALIMSEVPRIVADTIQDRSSPLRAEIDSTIEEARRIR